MRLEARGFSDLLGDLNEVLAASDLSVERVSNFVVRSTSARAKDSIRSGAKTGRIYARKNPDRVVQASAPGEAPADDTGNLADSITFQLFNTSGLVGYVGTNLFYGYDLEFGTANIAPRPFLYPAFREAIVAADGMLKREFEANL